MSEFTSGDNSPAIGKLRFLPNSASHGDILYISDRIDSGSNTVEVVLPVAVSHSVVDSSFTISSVCVVIARTKQTARASRKSKQPGITRALKEYTCFICGAKTELLHKHQRHLARVHKKYEDGTDADDAYCDKFANKRSKKWQNRAAMNDGNAGENGDVEHDCSPVAKVRKVKKLRRIKKVSETELMEVGDTHTIPLSQKIGMGDISCTSSVSDAMKVEGGHNSKFPPSVAGISQDKMPVHSATLTLPATGSLLMRMHTIILRCCLMMRNCVHARTNWQFRICLLSV